MERRPCGCDYEVKGYSTRDEACRMAMLLELQPGRRLLDVGARRMAESSAMLVNEVFPHQPCAIISPTREICGLGIYRGRTLILSIRISMGWLWVFSLQNSIRADGGIRQNSLIILHSPRK